MADSHGMREQRAAVPGGVAEAMNRVLSAEREASAELEACRAEAEKTLEAARREARSLIERAEHLAREVHGRTERLAATRARHIVEAASRRQGDGNPAGTLAAAVRRLAARMTGDDHA